MIDGLYETHLLVEDIDTEMSFYGDTLGFELGRHDGDRGVAFYFVPGNQESMIGLWTADTVELPHFAAGHVAFRVDESKVPDMLPYLERLHIEPKSMYGCPADEPVVQPWLPAANVYFEDPENNLLELNARLSDPPRPDLDPLSLSEWKESLVDS